MDADRLEELLTYLEKRGSGFDRARLMRLAENMAAAGFERDDPVREVMSRLGDSWSALLISVLTTGPYRHAALRRIIAVLSAEKEISQRMLTLRLRALERDGIVDREIEDTVPPTVTYFLTDMGEELAEKLQGVIDWIKANETKIKTARDRFTE